ncbi:probable G-protein coupled receptor 139 [Hypanus sabinus]|uniref:probable G-protein coupled receptor 139 n=1 Tax=Hypanus sabinus TaxID=79690 RepID=UPI0028C41CEC|nr:probable G-protein coupled receptor 139 [Hypanus sabinus]
MAAADLLAIVTEVILYRISKHYFPMSFLDITPVCRSIYVLSYVAIDCSVWFTVTFTLDRHVVICCQKLRSKYNNERTAALILATIGTLLCVKNVPLYFAQKSVEVIDNVPWLCVMMNNFYTDPGWVAFDGVIMILTPLLPFVVIVLLNALTVRHILVASRVRKGLRGRSEGKNHSDPEMESRRRSVVLLVTLSGSFIVLWLTVVVDFAYYQITGTAADRNDSEEIFHDVAYLLSNVSCCTNTFIYAATQSKFREQVKKAVTYPAASLRQLLNKIVS